jgi:ABC-2 type transport system ATP-binding protein
MSTVIETRGLRKVYPLPKNRRQRPQAAGAPAAAAAPGGPGIVALDGLDLDVSAGEFFGLLGPNGAGKTTTIGVLTTRVRPTEGTAKVAGADVVREASSVKRLIGVVPQRPNPDRGLRVLENLVFHASYFGIPYTLGEKRGRELLERFDLSARAEAKVDELSGGQQQRLMIARALMHQPQVIFLDEPTVGLDPQARHAVWELLKELQASGRTIIMTTHYMEEADQLCQRIAIIDRGRLLALDTPSRLKAQAPGGTLIELILDRDAQQLAEKMSAVDGIPRIEPRGNVLRVYADRPADAVPALFRAAQQEQYEVRDVHLAAPSLETLFISLTGRKLE